MRLKDKVILVTGSTTGIGEAIARRAVAEGANVLIHGRDRKRGEALVTELGQRTALHVDDIADPAAPARIVEAAVKAFGKLDALVNNAASVQRSNLANTDAALFDKLVERGQIDSKERVVVIFTHGDNLHIDPNDHTGYTGDWIMDANRARQARRVIIYLRDDAMGVNKLYVASVDGVDPAPGHAEPRHKLRFSHCQFTGITPEDWPSFADIAKGGGQNPVRYLP